MDTLHQKTDQKIIVPVFYQGIAVDTALLIDATYVLYSKNKKHEVLRKTLLKGITVADENNLEINISKEDSAQLRGVYYHELSLVHDDHGCVPGFKKDINFDNTYN